MIYFIIIRGLHYYSLKWWKTLKILTPKQRDLPKVHKKLADLSLRSSSRTIRQAANRPRVLKRAGKPHLAMPVSQLLRRGLTAMLGVRCKKRGIKKKREFWVNAPTGRGDETTRETRGPLPADTTRTAHL